MTFLSRSRLALLTGTLPLLVAAGAACTSSSNGTDGAATTVTAGRSATPATDPTTTGAGRTTTSTDDDTDTTDDDTDPTVDDTDTTDDAGLPDACDLITEDDAAAAIGEPVEAGDQRSDECWWSSANDLKTVNIIRRTGDIDTWRAGLQNSSWEPIDIGDEGYAGKVLDSITFRIDDTTYEINVIYSTKGDPDQVVRDLADLVISRL